MIIAEKVQNTVSGKIANLSLEAVRVVCGLLETIAIFCPISLLRIELLPTLGLPTMAINADLSLLSVFNILPHYTKIGGKQNAAPLLMFIFSFNAQNCVLDFYGTCTYKDGRNHRR